MIRLKTSRRGRARRFAPTIDSLEQRLALTAGALANVGLTTGWATFGEALPQGAAFNGLKVGDLVTQTDVKTRWPDGSIRFAVVSASVPATGQYAITAATAAAGTFTPTLPTAAVKLNIGGTVYTADLPRSPSVDEWLDGPLVTEGRFTVTPVSASGKPHSFLRVIFDVRTYRDGGNRLDVTVENTLDQSDATQVLYNVDIVANGKNVYHHDNVTHYYGTRWRQVFNLGLTESQETLDFSTFNQAGAIPPYLSIVTNEANSVTGSNYDILQNGDVDAYMPGHGGRGSLAPYPDWTARYLVHGDPKQQAVVLANGDLSGSWPIHLREPSGPTRSGGPTYQGLGDGKLISIDERPNFWYDSRADPGNAPAADSANYVSGYDSRGALASPLTPDIAHQPSLAYVPYLVTGDRYYADEMAFWANYTLIRTYQNSYSNPRGGSQGLLQPNEVRGIGWGLRNLADAAAYLPDGDPVKPYLAQKVDNNLKWMDNYADSARGPNNPLGILWADKRPENDTMPSKAWIALWEQIYVAWAVDHANKQGFSGGDHLRDQIAKFQISLFNSPDYPKDQAAPYVLSVGSRDSQGRITYYTSLSQIWNNGTNQNTRPFPGYYGPEARLMAMIGIENKWAGAQSAYDYLFPSIGVNKYVDGVSDLARRAGWATDLSSPSSPPSDTVAPTVSAQSPASGAVDVMLNVPVTATFSEAVQSGTIVFTLVDSSNKAVAATVSYDATRRTVTLTPSAPLTKDTKYTARLSGAKDAAGNVMTAVSWSFTTDAPPSDTVAPTVTGRSPAVNGTGVDVTIQVTATFSEAVQSGTIAFTLVDPSNKAVAATVSYDATRRTVTLTPSTPLAAGTKYTARLSGAKDAAGNVMTAVSWSFTTAAAKSGSWQQRLADDFASGTFDGAAVTGTNGGAVQLGSAFRDDFQRTTLGQDWRSSSWGSNNRVAFQDGSLSVAGAEVLARDTTGLVPVEGRIQFGASTYQHFGLATDLGSVWGNAWAIFSTGGTTNTLYARVNINGTQREVRIGALPTGYHLYRVEPISNGFRFSVDGTVKATIQTASNVPWMSWRPALSAYNGGSAPALKADWVQVATNATKGVFTSTTFDAGRMVAWGQATWTADVPAGTSLIIETSSSTDGTTWSSWSGVSNGGQIKSPASRYLRYRVQLQTGDPGSTPALYDITFNWT